MLPVSLPELSKPQLGEVMSAGWCDRHAARYYGLAGCDRGLENHFRQHGLRSHFVAAFDLQCKERKVYDIQDGR